MNIEIHKEKCAIIFVHLIEKREENLEQTEQIMEFKKEEIISISCW